MDQKKHKNINNIISSNKKAFINYHILEKFEAGIALKGTEVKSVKLGNISIQEGYIQIDNNIEAWLIGSTIQPYEHGNNINHKIDRERKLLLHKKEIDRLYGKIREKGLTLVPLKIYVLDNIIKIQIALAKGKDGIDKRDSIKKRDSDRERQRAMKNFKR